MTLQQKREIVARFKSGVRVSRINGFYRKEADDDEVWQPWSSLEIEQVLRDFMKGKFTLGRSRR